MSFNNQPFLIILNTGAHRVINKKGITELERILDRNGIIYEINETSSHSESRQVAREASGSYQVVVAAGGDGTISSVAAGLSGTSCKLGILPLGSGNDISRGINIPRNLNDAVSLLQHGTVHPVDLGTYHDTGVFLNTLGFGFDGKVSYDASMTTLFQGRFKYIYAVLKSIFTFRASRMTVELSGESYSDRFLMVTIANGPVEGGGIRIAPEASLNDGLFDVVMITDVGLIRRIPLLLRILIRGNKNEKRILVRRSQSVSIQSTEPQFVHADGELVSKSLDQITATIKSNVVNVITGW